MNYVTYAALTNYATTAAAIAANPTNGAAWLLNETKIKQDGRMANPRAANTDENTHKKGTQRQMARTLTPTINRNRTDRKSSPGGGSLVNIVTAANTKAPAIRHKVSWYVTDTSAAAGYRRVFGILEDPTTTNAYRDDDSQVRL